MTGILIAIVCILIIALIVGRHTYGVVPPNPVDPNATTGTTNKAPEGK